MPDRLRAAVPMLALLLFPQSNLEAQSCAGNVGFDAGRVRLGAGAMSTDGAKSYGAEIALGRKAGPFASASYTTLDYDDVDDGATAVAVSAGYAVAIDAAKKTWFCPMAGYTRQNGPNIDIGLGVLDVSVRTIAFGGSFGGTVTFSPTMSVVPFAGVMYNSADVRVEFNGTPETNTEDYGVVTVGAGFILNKTLSIQPLISKPFGTEPDGEKPIFGIMLAFSFGGSGSTSTSGAKRAR